jgi:hypothetical protein
MPPRTGSTATTLAEAIELLDAVLDLDYGDECNLVERDRFVSMFDTSGDDQAIVAEHGGDLRGLTRIDGEEQLLRWVELVRQKVLDELAYRPERSRGLHVRALGREVDRLRRPGRRR